MGIIKLNMSCTTTSSYINLITLIITRNADWTFKISLFIILNVIMGLTSKFENYSSQLCLLSQKHIPAVLKDTKEIPMRHIILTMYKSRKSGQLSVPRWIPCYHNTYINYFRGGNYCVSIINVRKDLPRFTG